MIPSQYKGDIANVSTRGLTLARNIGQSQLNNQLNHLQGDGFLDVMKDIGKVVAKPLATKAGEYLGGKTGGKVAGSIAGALTGTGVRNNLRNTASIIKANSMMAKSKFNNQIDGDGVYKNIRHRKIKLTPINKRVSKRVINPRVKPTDSILRNGIDQVEGGYEPVHGGSYSGYGYS
jgi:hypothetical protein